MAVLSLNETRPTVRGEDLPYEDGIPLESEWHLTAMTLLIDILRYHFRDRRDCYVAGNMFVYFDPDQVKTRNFRGPDLFVVKGVKDKGLRKSWVVWEENDLTPDFVIELASESTAKFDVTKKKGIYEGILKTPEYVVYNPDTEELKGWRLSSGHYTPIALDQQGRLWSEELALWLGIAAYTFPGQTNPIKVLRFFDAAGNLLPTPQEAESQRAEREAHRAEAEAQRAKAEAHRAEREAHRAEAEAHRAERETQRAEAEAQRAEAEAHHAEREAQRATAEAEARRDAEAEIARLKALLAGKK